MAGFNDLTRDQKLFANRLFSASVEAFTGDPFGHLPNCGYTNEKPICECQDRGRRLMQVIVDEVARG